MRVIVTGSSNGIGRATARKFLLDGHIVHGIDKDDSPFLEISNYFHHVVDVRDMKNLPDIEDVDILINNAGTQNDSIDLEYNRFGDISTNLIGLINTTEKYGLQPNIKSIVNLASVSAHNGAEFPLYVASKGGVLAYSVWTSKKIAKWGATCNSLSFGGVITDLNRSVIDDHYKWNEIMKQTPLEKWATPDECAQWIYFFTVVNKSCTGQDLIIDNGETTNAKFVW